MTTEPIHSRTKTFSDPEVLLQGANRASEKVAALHIAFLVLCTYVLVIVVSTTDMDLLIGKSIKLPAVDVEVPITGFYATVPYLVVLVHFNLLLQLQLLSRKLFAFDEAAPKEEFMGGPHDQLHIFPYNYYLVGRPSPLIRHLIAVLVNITILVFPLLTLLILEARFLAYQSEAITWLQRLAIWLDVGLVATLWPVCMDRQDSWKAYLLSIGQSAKIHWWGWTWHLFGLVILTGLFIIPLPKLPISVLWLAVLWLLLSTLASPLRLGVRWMSHGHYCATKPGAVSPILGVRGLFFIILLGLPLPLLITVDGERVDFSQLLVAALLSPWRHLDLHERVLLTKSVKFETIADLRSHDPAKIQSAMRAIETMDLQNRSLRHANLRRAVMAKADMRGALLEGADLMEAQLQEANLENARLQGADLSLAQLQGALLSRAQLQGAHLIFAQLQGALMQNAQLQGALMSGAQLQGALLDYAQLQGAFMNDAHLQGASLQEAQFQGADLEHAQLQGADMRNSTFYHKSLGLADVRMVDARGMQWRPLSQDEVEKLQTDASSKWIKPVPFIAIRDATTMGLEAPEIKSCLRDDKTELQCAEVYSLDKIRKVLQPELKKLVCLSESTARGILFRYDRDGHSTDSIMSGFRTYLHKSLEQSKSRYDCWGLSAWTEVNTALLKKFSDAEREKGLTVEDVSKPQ